ncbi:hypothetical protein AB0B48_24445 [Micromonospora sp. NPDC049089]|uniref:hypothetical protein n=1 Tax=Micromonospora sp. NPDC049089 TaxID=3155496 RepID=UPI003407791B
MDALTAATATPEPGGLPWWAWIALGLIVWALYYVAECAWWPFGPCPKCDGRGKFKRNDGKAWRKCRRCKATGERLRFGRKVWNRFAKIRNASR